MAVSLTVVLWALAFVGIRAVATTVPPGPLALGRLLVGTAVLAPAVLRTRRHWPKRHHLARLAVVGVLWFGVYNVALNEGEHHLQAGVAALVVAIGPILIALLAGRFLGEGFPPALFAGGAVAVAGVGVVALSAGEHTADATGVILCMGAAVAYSIAMVTQKSLLAEIDPIVVTWLACSIGAVTTLPFAPELVTTVRHAPVHSLLIVAGLGLGPTAIAFTSWAYALRWMPAGRLAATAYIVPLLSLLIAWVVLGEMPAALALLGGGVTLLGVALSRLRRRRDPAVAAAQLRRP